MPSARSPGELLAEGIARLGLGLDPSRQERLLAYLALLARWNRVYNLTAVRDPAAMVPKHLLDSLAVLPHVRGPRLVDVGTGGGLPGIPLALARPELQVVLLDSNAKKVRFVTHALLELGLTNAEAVHARVEVYRPAAGFDTVIARAYSSLSAYVEAAAPLCAAGGRLLAMKGAYPQEELTALPPGYRTHVQRLEVPGLDAERHLVCIMRDPAQS
jgi:16S rRNA (guanine527-N7)-methyltransferase